MIKRKYVVLSLLTLVSIILGSLLYSNLVSAQGTVTGYVSIPPAAFEAGESTKYFGTGNMLANFESSDLHLYAPVQLPHGATVTNVTFHWYDGGAEWVYLYLWRIETDSGYQAMTEMKSTGPPPYWGSSYNDTIDYATVDNIQYSYFLGVIIPDSGTHTEYVLVFAVIEYTLPIEPEPGVGGLYIPVDKFSLLAPYIALVSTIILAVSMSVAYIKYRKKQ